MTVIRAAVMLIAAGALAGCGEVPTRYPIGSTTGLARDPALVETWLPRAEKSKDIERTADGKVAGYIHVLPSKDGTFDIVMVSLPSKPGNKGDYQIYRATTGQAGGSRRKPNSHSSSPPLPA